jgi:hypothetical protein
MSAAKYGMLPPRAEAFQQAAHELLTEALERGDQDSKTVTWAVSYLLRRADGSAA